MPLFTTSIQNQEQAASSGDKSYPETSQLPINSSFSDFFNRETLNTTNAYALYTSAGTGTEVVSIQNNNALRLTTGVVTGDDVDIRTSGMSFLRSGFLNSKSQIVLEVVFVLAGTVASQEEFIGLLLDAGAAITALPTTARHMGIYFDKSAGATFILSSADGTTQSTTDSLVTAVADTYYRIRITWTGINSATVELYTGTDLKTLSATHTVTALDTNTNRAYGLHFFINSESITTPSLDIYEWMASAT